MKSGFTAEGTGLVTAGRILANAFVLEGKYGSSFPIFGFERRGAPVTSFFRFDNNPIREKTQIYNPDCLGVLEPSLKNSLGRKQMNFRIS